MAQITPDAPDITAARKNREAIEGGPSRGVTVELPRGTVHVDRNVLIGPDTPVRELVGAGMDATSLVNSHTTWPDNRTLLVQGDEFGWRGEKGRITYEFGVPLDPASVAEGAREFRLAPGIPATRGAVGRLVYVTAGPLLDDPLCGEFRRVSGCDPATRTLGLDRPLRRDQYGRIGPDVAVIFGRPACGVTVRDLTIGQPVHPGADPFYAKWCVGLRLERVRFGRPGEPVTGPALCCCGYVTMEGCETVGQLGLNNVHDLVVRGGRYGAVVGEECCTDTDLSDLIVAPNGRRMAGIHWYLESDRLTLRSVRVEGAGAWVDPANPSPGSYPSLAVSGRECVLRDVSVIASAQHTPGYCGIGLNGDGLRVSGLWADVPAYLDSGLRVRLEDVVVPAWAVRPGTTGAAVGCPRFPESEGWQAVA